MSPLVALIAAAAACRCAAKIAALISSGRCGEHERGRVERSPDGHGRVTAGRREHGRGRVLGRRGGSARRWRRPAAAPRRVPR